MLKGAINADFEAVVEVNFYNSDGEPNRLPAVIDTGFSGMVCMPADLVLTLNLERSPYPPIRVQTANGEIMSIVPYFGYIDWQNNREKVMIYPLGDAILLGMRLLLRGKTTIERASVTIE